MHLIIGLIIAFILVALLSNRATRSCRWREFRENGQSRWTCIHCGAETQGPQGKPPKTCLRHDKGG